MRTKLFSIIAAALVSAMAIGFVASVDDIFHHALISPYTAAEQEIEDENIARFYHNLIGELGLADHVEK